MRNKSLPFIVLAGLATATFVRADENEAPRGPLPVKNEVKELQKKYVIKPGALERVEYPVLMKDGHLIGEDVVVSTTKHAMSKDELSGISDLKSFREASEAATKQSRERLKAIAMDIRNPDFVATPAPTVKEEKHGLDVLTSHPEAQFAAFRDCAVKVTPLLKAYIGQKKLGGNSSEQEFLLKLSDQNFQSYAALLKDEMFCSQHLPSPLKIKGRVTHDQFIEQAIVLSVLGRLRSFEQARPVLITLYALYGAKPSKAVAWLPYWKALSLKVLFDPQGKFPTLTNPDLHEEISQIESRYLKVN